MGNRILFQIRKDLEDALDMYNFESEVSGIEGMVREKEYMLNVSDIGKDLEHCKELQHKLSEANTDMTVNQKIQKAKQVSFFFFSVTFPACLFTLSNICEHDSAEDYPRGEQPRL